MRWLIPGIIVLVQLLVGSVAIIPLVGRGFPLARSIILHLTVDNQTVEGAAEQIGSLIALHIEVTGVLESQLAGTLTEQLLQEIVLVGGKILGWVAFSKSLQTYTGTDLVDVFQSLDIVAVSLKQSLCIDEIEVGKTHLYPVWLLALVGRTGDSVGNVLVVEIACSKSTHTLVWTCTGIGTPHVQLYILTG